LHCATFSHGPGLRRPATVPSTRGTLHDARFSQAETDTRETLHSARFSTGVWQSPSSSEGSAVPGGASTTRRPVASGSPDASGPPDRAVGPDLLVVVHARLAMPGPVGLRPAAVVGRRGLEPRTCGLRVR